MSSKNDPLGGSKVKMQCSCQNVHLCCLLAARSKGACCQGRQRPKNSIKFYSWVERKAVRLCTSIGLNSGLAPASKTQTSEDLWLPGAEAFSVPFGSSFLPSAWSELF